MALNKDIENRPLVADKWAEIVDINRTHVHGKPPTRLFKTRRPLESTNEYALAYRVENFQPITKQSFNTAIAAIIETAKHIYVEEVNVTDTTADYLEDYEIKVAGKKFNLKDYVVKFVGFQAEVDPNSILVAYPIHPTEELVPDYREDLPNFDTIQNQSIEIGIELVGSDRIHRLDEDHVVYYAGEWLYEIEKGKEKYAPYYIMLTKEETSLIVPVPDKKQQYVYDTLPYYLNDLEQVPFDVVGNNAVFEDVEGEMVEYHEVTYAGAVAIGNEVLGVKSDSQIVDTRFTYPEKFMQMERCGHPGCVSCTDPDSPYAGLFVVYESDGSCTTCSNCSGTGKVAPDSSPLGTHWIAKSDLFTDSGDFIPPVQYVTPPLESPQYLDDKWRKDYEAMERALFIMTQNMTNQSGESKSYDLRQKVTVITKAVMNIMTIYQNALNWTQGYLRGDMDIYLILPADFNIRSSDDITNELATAVNTSSAYSSELNSELLLKKFGNSAVNRRIVNFIEVYDKLYGKTIDEIVKLKAIYGTDLAVRDQVVNDKAWAVLSKLANERDDFLTLSEEQLKALFDAEINAIMGLEPDREQIAEDPLLALEAEAKSKLKGTVGGVQGIIQINAAVAAGQMSAESAQVLMEQIYGFPPDIAARLIEEREVVAPPPPPPTESPIA